MIGRLAYLRDRLDTSIWLIPIGLCVISGLLAVLTLWLDRHLASIGLGMGSFAMSLAAARQVIGVIASSIISVGGVAFSVTMVALTLTSGQYGPKILRNFLEDNVAKLTLGFFLGTYVYTLIVLSGYAEADRPRFTVLVSLLLAFVSLLSFVHFIHRTAADLQADRIVHRIGEQLQRALQRLGDEANLAGRSFETIAWRRAARMHRALPIASNVRGYVQTVDYLGLGRWCVDNDCVLQVRVRAGDFIVDGVCLFKAYGCAAEGLENAVAELNAHVVVGPMRTPVQDPEHAITQLNQLAARALSPGINDPGTAITCIDWFSLALAQLVDRDLPGCVFLDQEQRPRLLARITDFSGLMKAIYAPLRQFARSEVSVTVSLIQSLCRLAELTQRTDRLRTLAHHGEMIWNAAREQALSEYDLRDIHQRHIQLMSLTRPGSSRVA